MTKEDLLIELQTILDDAEIRLEAATDDHLARFKGLLHHLATLIEEIPMPDPKDSYQILDEFRCCALCRHSASSDAREIWCLLVDRMRVASTGVCKFWREQDGD